MSPQDLQLLKFAWIAANPQGSRIQWAPTRADYVNGPAQQPVYWNPFAESGDCFDLAIETGVLMGNGFQNAWNALYAVGLMPKDKKEAYRRAVVMAAAACGKELVRLGVAKALP